VQFFCLVSPTEKKRKGGHPCLAPPQTILDSPLKQNDQTGSNKQQQTQQHCRTSTKHYSVTLTDSRQSCVFNERKSDTNSTEADSTEVYIHKHSHHHQKISVSTEMTNNHIILKQVYTTRLSRVI